MSDNKNGEIVLCKMFSGEYWKNPNNIGYESINMFLPDNSNDENFEESIVLNFERFINEIYKK